MFNKTVFLIILVLALFYGCGGGGGTTTDSTPDTTPPTVSSTNPANSATGVAVNSAITAIFSEAMTASTVTTAFTVSGVSGTVSYTGTAATFTPSSNLANSTTYTATITTAVKDEAGNPIGANYTWTFTTASAVSFASDIQPIFDSFCIDCHVLPGGASSFLPLTTGVSYSNLYNQSQTHTTGGGLIVKPFDSANSVLYQRISGIGLDVSEQRMPLNLTPLVSGDQTLIKTWIDEGALNN